MRRSPRLLWLLVLSFGFGCASAGQYFRFRALDLLDCVKLNAGVGLGLTVDARVTDLFAPGLGYMSYTTNFGWENRDLHGRFDECVVITTPRRVIESAFGSEERRASRDYDLRSSIGWLALSSVTLANERWIRNPAKNEVTVDYYSLFNFAPVDKLLRATDAGDFFLDEGETAIVKRKSLWQQGWLEVGVTLVAVEARAGVNPLEVVDFVLGLAGLDPAGDDRILLEGSAR